MRILCLSEDYPAFLEAHYERTEWLRTACYADQLRARNESMFGHADFYSRALNGCGQDARDLHANNENMQRAWAREHGVELPPSWARRFRFRRGFVPSYGKARSLEWYWRTLASQLSHYQPDAVINHVMDRIEPRFIRRHAPPGCRILGQIAAPLRETPSDLEYDLVLSSLPNMVARFKARGIDARLQKLAFEPRALEQSPASERDVPVAFTGSFTRHHPDRPALIDAVSRVALTHVWAHGIEHLADDIRRRICCHGPVFGRDMFAVLRRSRIVLNQHIDVAGEFANNMRLYEATGMGALLITDWKRNLADILEPGKEVETYKSPEECAEKVAYYLSHEAERAAIAEAGTNRTLKEHTFDRRARELVKFIEAIRGPYCERV